MKRSRSPSPSASKKVDAVLHRVSSAPARAVTSSKVPSPRFLSSRFDPRLVT
jgi:hypothetical protein